MSVAERNLFKTPYAVVAINTTGFNPQRDYLVEIAVAVLRGPDSQRPQVVFDTLIRPPVPVVNTVYHDVTESDVADAPRFAEIADGLLAALAGRVVAAHASDLVMGFLDAEFERAGRAFHTPHLCTLRMDRLVEVEEGTPGSLFERATAFGVDPPASASAAEKARCSAELLRTYLVRMKRGHWRTFEDLRDAFGHDEFAFLRSFDDDPLPTPELLRHDDAALKPRLGQRRPASRLAQYLDEVLASVADLHIDAMELESVRRARRDLQLDPDEVRAVHAKVFDAALQRYNEDSAIDVYEVQNLHRLAEALRLLGWAPGDPVEPASSR